MKFQVNLYPLYVQSSHPLLHTQGNLYLCYYISSIPYYMHKLFCTYVIISPAYEVCIVYSFRHFQSSYLHICLPKAHNYMRFKDNGPSLSAYPYINLSVVCPSTFSSNFFSATTGPI